MPTGLGIVSNEVMEVSGPKAGGIVHPHKRVDPAVRVNGQCAARIWALTFEHFAAVLREYQFASTMQINADQSGIIHQNEPGVSSIGIKLPVWHRRTVRALPMLPFEDDRSRRN